MLSNIKKLSKVGIAVTTVICLLNSCSKVNKEINLSDLSGNNLLVVNDSSFNLYRLADMKILGSKKDDFKNFHKIVISKDKKWGLAADSKGRYFAIGTVTGRVRELPETKGAVYPYEAGKFLVYNNLQVSEIDLNTPQPTMQNLLTLTVPTLPAKYVKDNELQLMSMLGAEKGKIWYAVHTKAKDKLNTHNSFIYTYDISTGNMTFMGAELNINSYPMSMEYDEKNDVAMIADLNKPNDCANYTSVGLIDAKKPGKVVRTGPYTEEDNTYVDVTDFEFLGKNSYQASFIKTRCDIRNADLEANVWKFTNGKWEKAEDSEGVLKQRILPNSPDYSIDIHADVVKGSQAKLFKTLQVAEGDKNKELLNKTVSPNDFVILSAPKPAAASSSSVMKK